MDKKGSMDDIENDRTIFHVYFKLFIKILEKLLQTDAQHGF